MQGAAFVALAMSWHCQGKVIAAFPENFVGVGVELTLDNDEPRVVKTLSGGPAEVAGLTANDHLIAIDKTPTKGHSLADVVAQLRGASGTTVDVTVRREGIELSTTLHREPIRKTVAGYAAQ